MLPIFTPPTIRLRKGRSVLCQLYADDTQLLDCCHIEHVLVVRIRLTSYVSEFAQWCASRRLQLNSDKTEVIWFDSKTNLIKLKSYDCSLPVGSETVQPASVVRDLCVLLDSKLTMKQHINKVTAACYYQLR